MGREVSGASSSCRQSCARGCGATRSPGRPQRGSSAPLQHNPIRRNRRLVEPITTSALDARVRVLASTAPTAGAAAARRRVPSPNPCARAPGLALASPGGGRDGHPLAAAPGLAACLVSRPVPGRAWAWGRATERQGRRRLQKSIRSTILRIGVVSPTGLIALGI